MARNARQKMQDCPMVQGAVLASQFAKEIGLPVGNMWEPGIARSIAKELREYTFESVESHWRMQLGLEAVNA